MSQPPMSTIFAPSARWVALRTVFWVMAAGRKRGAHYRRWPGRNQAGQRVWITRLNYGEHGEHGAKPLEEKVMSGTSLAATTPRQDCPSVFSVVQSFAPASDVGNKTAPSPILTRTPSQRRSVRWTEATTSPPV